MNNVKLIYSNSKTKEGNDCLIHTTGYVVETEHNYVATIVISYTSSWGSNVPQYQTKVLNDEAEAINWVKGEMR